MRCFWVVDWPGGWVTADQEGTRITGIAVRCWRWTVFLVWGPGPYLT